MCNQIKQPLKINANKSRMSDVNISPKSFEIATTFHNNQFR